MSLLKIENTYSNLITKDEDVKYLIWKILRFQERNYWNSSAFKSKIWDGYREFFKLKTGRFLTGLLPEVSTILKQVEFKYQIQDLRKKVEWSIKSIDENFIDGVKLRDYQVESTNKIIKQNRGLIYAPTSAGKTLTLSSMVKCLPEGTKILVVGNRKSLVEQNYDELVSRGIANVGRYYSEKRSPDIITCCTLQSIKKINDLLPHIQAIFVDEIHDMMSKSAKGNLYNKLNNCYIRVAMSATPFKFGGSDKVQKYETKGYFGLPITIKSAEDGILTTKELQTRGILSQANCFFYPVYEPELKHCVYMDAVKYGIAENIKFHQQVCRIINSIKGRTLIIVDRIQHGDLLHEMIPNSIWVRGEDNNATRKVVIDRLKKEQGSIVAIATSGIFNTGINVFIHNLINAAGGQADHQIIQRFGRGLRKADDKISLNYFDFIFYNNMDYLYKHSVKRIEILRKEGHKINVLELLN